MRTKLTRIGGLLAAATIVVTVATTANAQAISSSQSRSTRNAADRPAQELPAYWWRA
jgi:hypothetical protein